MDQPTKNNDVETIIASMPVHWGAVYQNALYNVKDVATAQDIAQNTFVRAIEFLQKKDQYYETGKEKNLLLTICSNLCLDHFRIVKRKKVSALTPNITGGTDEGKEKELLKKDRAVEVHRLIDQLPPEQREIVVLRYFYGLKFKEIACMKNLSVNTCTGQMRYALNRMRTMIANEKD